MAKKQTNNHSRHSGVLGKNSAMAATSKIPTVLLVENDGGQCEIFKRFLEIEGYVNVDSVTSLSQAHGTWDPNKHSAVILDINLEANSRERELVKDESAGRSSTDGELFARYMHKRLGELKSAYPIFGFSLAPEMPCEWFKIHAYPQNGIGVYSKNTQMKNLKINLLRALRIDAKKVTVFIVHGNDLDWLEEFKRLARALGFEPLTVENSVEHQHRHWLDRIESLLDKSDLGWVIHTPDDWVLPRKSNDEECEAKLHSRPNVLFEHGLLFGRFGRSSGRVLVFQCGKVQMPSDIQLPVIQVPSKPIADDVIERIRKNLGTWYSGHSTWTK
jgi:predicted nucleotide-binding protein